RGLAPSLPRPRRRLRPPAHPRDEPARRRPLRGGLARLSAGVAPPLRRPASARARRALRARAGGRDRLMIRELLPDGVAAVEVRGIDAEIHDELPEGVLGRISLPEEREWLEARAGDETSWDTVLFSAKESVFKAWFPLARRWLGFEDAHVDLAPEEGAFQAR